jgi:cytochrome c-type biogenesis protein CcmI
MMQFWLILASTLTAVLLCVVAPLLGRSADARVETRYADSRSETLAAANYWADMAELVLEFAAGNLSSAQYDLARHELDRRLIDETRPHTGTASTASARPHTGNAQPASGDWPGRSAPLTGEHRIVELTNGDVRP